MKLHGLQISNEEGQKLGSISRLMADPDTGRIRYGVLDPDPALGIGQSRVAVPWGAFAVSKGDAGEVRVTLDATKEKLSAAPKFNEADANRLYGRTEAEPVYTYWSVLWIDEIPPVAEMTTGTSSATSSPSPNPYGTGTSSLGTGSGLGTSGTLNPPTSGTGSGLRGGSLSGTSSLSGTGL